MPVYSINDIEKLSGVKAHTIRIWEKRYNFLPHRRTDTNIRYYKEEDLELILNVAHLNKNGFKISRLANMSRAEIKHQVASSCEVDVIFDQQIDGLMLSMFELNEYKFLKILNHKISAVGFEKTMEEYIYPLLEKLSVMWIAGSVKTVHENFINNIIKRKLIIEIDRLKIDGTVPSKKFVIYLPEYEAHEMSLLYSYFILKQNNADVLYMGSNVNVSEVKDAVEIFKPEFVFTFFNESFNEIPLQPYIEEVSSMIGSAQLIISGIQALQQNTNLPTNTKMIKSLLEVKEFCK